MESNLVCGLKVADHFSARQQNDRGTEKKSPTLERNKSVREMAIVLFHVQIERPLGDEINHPLHPYTPIETPSQASSTKEEEGRR